MKIAIVGFDIEGRATYEYLKKLGGHEITICDQNEQVSVPDGLPSRLGDGYLNGLDEFDVIVRTAGLSPRKILAQNPGVAERITTHVNLFFGGSPTANIIGITGTKGKSTTVELLNAILEAAGKKTAVAGTIRFKVGNETRPNLFKMTMPGRFFIQKFLRFVQCK